MSTFNLWIGGNLHSVDIYRILSFQVTNYDSATGLPLIQLWSMIGDEVGALPLEVGEILDVDWYRS